MDDLRRIARRAMLDHGLEPDFPPAALGLLPPPTPGATSVWEDASTIDLPDWNEFGSSANLKHFLLMIARNIGDGVEQLCGYTLLIPAIAIIARPA